MEIPGLPPAILDRAAPRPHRGVLLRGLRRHLRPPARFITSKPARLSPSSLTLWSSYSSRRRNDSRFSNTSTTKKTPGICYFSSKLISTLASSCSSSTTSRPPVSRTSTSHPADFKTPIVLKRPANRSTQATFRNSATRSIFQRNRRSTPLASRK